MLSIRSWEQVVLASRLNADLSSASSSKFHLTTAEIALFIPVATAVAALVGGTSTYLANRRAVDAQARTTRRMINAQIESQQVERLWNRRADLYPPIIEALTTYRGHWLAAHNAAEGAQRYLQRSEVRSQLEKAQHILESNAAQIELFATNGTRKIWDECLGIISGIQGTETMVRPPELLERLVFNLRVELQDLGVERDRRAEAAGSGP